MEIREGDITTDAQEIIRKYQPATVIHLASVMSGEGEANMDKAMQVNLQGTLKLLEACREVGTCPKFLFASSIAAFGGASEVTEASAALPTTTYGTTKACAELLVADFGRKWFVDARTARLPTVIIRPGPPNLAATGCFSAVPKAVLGGYAITAPLPHDKTHPVISVTNAIAGLKRTHCLAREDVGGRPITLPALNVSLGHLVEVCSAEAEKRNIVPGRVSYQPDLETERIVGAMPGTIIEGARAQQLGLPRDESLRDVVLDYLADVPS
ncbi:unnamed protein product [Chrysoparadoxa australica]